MKTQYLGDAKDSFKWDSHDYVTHALGCSTALYWDVSAMFILLSRSEQVIRHVRRITEEYRREVVARRPDFQERLPLCVGG